MIQIGDLRITQPDEVVDYVSGENVWGYPYIDINYKDGRVHNEIFTTTESLEIALKTLDDYFK